MTPQPLCPSPLRIKPLIKWCLLFAFVFICSLVTSAQTIQTIAGNGSTTNSGDGGTALSAGINYPVAGVFDKEGSYYFVTGSVGNTVRKIGVDGTITTVAGISTAGYNGDNIPATNAMLNNPQGIAIDSTGDIYVADQWNNRIRKIDIVTGVISTVAGTGPLSYNGDGIPATAASLAGPLDLCFDRFQNLIIADYGNARVRKVNHDNGIISTIAGTGMPLDSPGGGMADTTPILPPSGVCTRGTDILIADWHGRIYRLAETGDITTIVGNGVSGSTGDDGLALEATTTPAKVAVNHYGDIFIAEYDLDRIRVVTEDGIIKTICGTGITGFSGDGGEARFARLNHPGVSSFDTCDNMIFPDSRNLRIRKVAFNPECLPISVPQITADAPLSIHPNPATNHLSITYAAGLQSVFITDMLGRTVLHQIFSGQHTAELPLQLSPGCYTIIVNQAPPQKLIIQ